MSGDISLSQSLGGLRIANPDSDSTPSPPPAAAPPESTTTTTTTATAASPTPADHPDLSEPSSNDPSPPPPERPDASHLLQPIPTESSTSSIDFNPNLFSTSQTSLHTVGPTTSSAEELQQPSPSSRLNHRQSMPIAQQAQLQAQSSYPPTASRSRPERSYPGNTSSSRPASVLYSHTNASYTTLVCLRQESGSESDRHAGAGLPTRERAGPYRPSAPADGPSMVPPLAQCPLARASRRNPWDRNGPRTLSEKGVKDFNFGRTLGEGSYSTVLAATDRQTLREYAIKVLDKRHIIKEKKVKYVNIEKDTLNRLTNPTWNYERSLYFVLDLASGGELLGFLKKMGTFDEECTRFYGAQILDAIDYMHSEASYIATSNREIVLLDNQMHQLLTDKNACKASDLWAFGCIIYQLLSGRPPFKAGNEYQTFQKIQKAPRLKPYSPPRETIKLNGSAPSIPPHMQALSGNRPGPSSGPSTNAPRPSARVITELPPPSQLDIDWSPVLTRNNERILKLGNLMVTSTAAPHSPHGEPAAETPKKFSRFFTGSTTKKRQRIVLITSAARLIIAAAGGEEKKAKMEMNLLGVTSWCIDTKDKHLIFEDPKIIGSDAEGTKYMAQEWLDALEQARDFANSQSMATSYSGDSAFNELSSLFQAQQAL
ncbi:3-phosphoinositide-dependent protein kinase 1 [Phyllosticta citriasiana]|uniref:3-phosphoinositide-dependent protein kinase 1 n=1 Tax=Phyllosticta citriasiana TaxID=595635 RepID=UPI0030FD9A2D